MSRRTRLPFASILGYGAGNFAFYGLFAPPALEGQGALLGYLMLLYTGTFLLWTVGAIP